MSKVIINYDFLFEDKQDDYQEVLRELRAGKAQLIDIRELSEWEQYHFKCAIHIPRSDLEQGKGIENLRQIKQDNKKNLHPLPVGQQGQKGTADPGTVWLQGNPYHPDHHDEDDRRGI